MASEVQFLQDLAVVTGIAALTSVIFQRLKFPLVFGLLAAGVIIGPHTPPFSLVRDEATLRTLADLGVVLLLFGLGLDFNLRGLKRVAGVAAVVTLVEVLFMFWAGFEIASLLGWDRLDAIFLGAMLSISSTAIIVAVLREMGRLSEESSRVIFAVLVLEDIAAILMLVLISGYSATGALPLKEAGFALGKMLLFLVALVVFGLLIVPRVADRVARRHRPEVLVLTVLAFALVGGVLSHLAGFHVGLGAFLLGAVLAESKSRAKVEEHLRPIHDYFAAIFFVSIGTLVDFHVLASYWRVVILLVLLVVIGKLLSGALATFLVGYPTTMAVSVGAALSQIGEFSFVIAALGISTGAMSEFLFPIVVGVAAATSFLSPFMIRYGGRMGEALGRVAPASFRTYGSVYTSWMQSVRQRPGAPVPPPILAARRGTAVAAILVFLVLGSGLLFQRPGISALARYGFGPPMGNLAYWGLVLAILVPTVYELHRQLQRWTAEAQRARGIEARGLGIRAVVEFTLYLVATILLGLPLLVATAPFLEHPFVLLAWIAAVLLAVILLWTQIRRLHYRIRKNVEVLLEEEHISVAVPDVLQALFSREFPLDLKADSVRLGDGDWAIARRLGELGMRSTTGASVVLVERASGEQVLPSAETVLLPGDRLTLIGAPKQITAARVILLRHSLKGPPGGDIRPGRIFISEDSAWSGARLSGLSLPMRHGLQVVAVLRGEVAIANPGPNEKLAAGDILIVLGKQEQVLAAAKLAGGPPSPDASRL